MIDTRIIECRGRRGIVGFELTPTMSSRGRFVQRNEETGSRQHRPRHMPPRRHLERDVAPSRLNSHQKRVPPIANLAFIGEYVWLSSYRVFPSCDKMHYGTLHHVSYHTASSTLSNDLGTRVSKSALAKQGTPPTYTHHQICRGGLIRSWSIRIYKYRFCASTPR